MRDVEVQSSRNSSLDGKRWKMWGNKFEHYTMFPEIMWNADKEKYFPSYRHSLFTFPAMLNVTEILFWHTSRTIRRRESKNRV